MTDHGYIVSFSGRAYSPAGTVAEPLDVDAHNRAVEARELAHWASQPVSFSPAYYHVEPCPIDTRAWSTRIRGCGVTVRTWLGTAIGHGLITSAHVNNFGARIIRVRVLGTNGAEYWGSASYDAELIRLHKVRG